MGQRGGEGTRGSKKERNKGRQGVNKNREAQPPHHAGSQPSRTPQFCEQTRTCNKRNCYSLLLQPQPSLAHLCRGRSDSQCRRLRRSCCSGRPHWGDEGGGQEGEEGGGQRRKEGDGEGSSTRELHHHILRVQSVRRAGSLGATSRTGSNAPPNSSYQAGSELPFISIARVHHLPAVYFHALPTDLQHWLWGQEALPSCDPHSEGQAAGEEDRGEGVRGRRDGVRANERTEVPRG